LRTRRIVRSTNPVAKVRRNPVIGGSSIELVLPPKCETRGVVLRRARAARPTYDLLVIAPDAITEPIIELVDKASRAAGV
jgi:hypothetical protein